MSANVASFPCPVCTLSGVFFTAQSLRDRLIQVSTNKILCPVCQEEIIGLDKLTIHLFSHVKLLAANENVDKDRVSDVKIIPKKKHDLVLPQKKPKPSTSKNKPQPSTVNTPVKFVKIYPKFPVISLNTLPIIDISQLPSKDCIQQREKVFVKAESAVLQANTACNICGLQFVDENILKVHRCLIHNIDDDANSTITTYQCHLCPKKFKMRGSLMVHLRVAHFGFSAGNKKCPAEKTESGKCDEKDQEDKPFAMVKIDNKQWQCDVCRKCFTTKYFLKKHKRLHTGETPYACTQCNKTFTFQQSYHKHLLYHNDEKPHICNYCGRAFKELSTLHNHQRIHTGEKPFSCETCGKCFRQRVSYLVHRRIHTGVMPYKCTACEKSFRYKVSQRTHKCQAQPPGTVVRQVGNLVEKLKKKCADSSTSNDKEERSNHDNYFREVSKANAELVLSGAKLSLDDMEADNFNLINDTFNRNVPEQITELKSPTQMTKNNKIAPCLDSNLEELMDSIPLVDKNMPSPSEILKKLCLSKDEDYSLSPDKTCENDFEIYKDIDKYL